MSRSTTGIRPLSDTELVDRLRKGEQPAFDALYDRYFKRVYHFVDKRLRSREDAEETTQEVFVSVFLSIDSFRGEAPFAAWIFGITRRTIASRFKRKRHATVQLSEDDSEQMSPVLSNMSLEPSPLEAYEYRERVESMRDAIKSRLNAEQRKLFELHHLQERPISEIAEELEKSEDAIKSNLYRTRKLLLSR